MSINQNEQRWPFNSEDTDYQIKGIGFKNKEKAEETICLLEDRDINYQYRVINTMHSRAKSVLRKTTDLEKRQNLTDALNIFRIWIDDYKTHCRRRENFNYLPLNTVKAYKNLAKRYKIEKNDFRFMKVYQEVGGDVKKLRGKKVDGYITWDIYRNRRLKQLHYDVKYKNIPMYESKGPLKGLPTKQHTKLIMWGYSDDVSKVKRCMNLVEHRNF